MANDAGSGAAVNPCVTLLTLNVAPLGKPLTASAISFWIVRHATPTLHNTGLKLAVFGEESDRSLCRLLTKTLPLASTTVSLTETSVAYAEFDTKPLMPCEIEARLTTPLAADTA